MLPGTRTFESIVLSVSDRCILKGSGMLSMGRPIALTVTGLIGISVALSTHAQAYRIRQLDSIPGTHTWCVELTDEGDVVGKTTDRFVVWQSSQGFARPAGLNLLHEYDEQTRIPSRTEHIDDAGYWYGSGPHGASV